MIGILRGVAVLLTVSACSGPESNDPISSASPYFDQRPNILLLVADDLGYSDIGPYGSEIPTPNIDQLAENGVTFSRFYAAPSCSPSRAMLMTGQDNHVAGLGNMAETVADNQVGLPGYEGHLREDVPTIAERLGSVGYHTYMTGKWHLGLAQSQSAHARGFERSFSLLFGAASHFQDAVGPDAHRTQALYREDGELVEVLPEGFFSTDFYTDRMIEYIDENLEDGRPFFAYVAYTAPHWPLQVPASYMERHRGRYDQGYDQVRAKRFTRMQKLGLVPAEMALPVRSADIAPWDSLDASARQSHARDMELYAGMVEHLDENIGQLVAYLADRGQLENTLIVFLSDNGGDSWGYGNGPPPVLNYSETFDNSLENRGKPGSFALYGREWAQVSNTPLRGYKGDPSEGGIRVPLIISGDSIVNAGTWNSSPVAITDLPATFLELAGFPSSEAGPGGMSLRSILTSESNAVRDESSLIGIEMWGSRAAIRGDMKLLSFAAPEDRRAWQLYDLANDPAEQKDLKEAQPENFEAMVNGWHEYTERNNVVLPDWPMKIRPPGKLPEK